MKNQIPQETTIEKRDRMEILHQSSRSSRLWTVICSTALIFSGISGAMASDRTITFKNTTGKTNDDLHIEFKQMTTSDSANVPGVYPGDRVNGNSTTHNFWGKAVTNGGSVTLVFHTVFQNLVISQWWWTTNGNATNDGGRVGDIKKDTSGTLLCSSGSAVGDGAVMVSVGGISQTFNTTAGNSQAQTLAAFSSFLGGFVSNSLPLTYSILTPDSVVLGGNVLGDPALELQCNVAAPDSGQTLTYVAGLTIIPTLREWGLIVLALLLLTVGTVFLLRRRRVAAGAVSGG